jgi:hypothetical protein
MLKMPIDWGAALVRFEATAVFWKIAALAAGERKSAGLPRDHFGVQFFGLGTGPHQCSVRPSTLRSAP